MLVLLLCASQTGPHDVGDLVEDEEENLRRERLVQLLPKVSRLTQGGFFGCRQVLCRERLSGLAAGGSATGYGPGHLCFGRRLGGLLRSTDKGKEAYQY